MPRVCVGANPLRQRRGNPSKLGMIRWVMLFLVASWTLKARDLASPPETEKQPVTVADAIRMSKLADPDYFAGGEPRRGVAQFSPDKRKFVVVLRRGNLERNTNEYSLLLWRCDELGRSAAPHLVLRMSSSSNRTAIEDIQWLADNETVVFLGERPGRSHQLYKFNIRTRHLEKITNFASNLLSYSITPDGSKVAFLVEEPARTIWNRQAARNGVIAGDQQIFDILTGQVGGSEQTAELYFQCGMEPPRQIVRNDKREVWGRSLWIAPRGDYILTTTRVADVPAVWKEYSDRWIHSEATKVLRAGEASGLMRLDLVDATTGRTAVLIDAPCRFALGAEAIWAGNSTSVVISDVYLPLEQTTGETRQARRSLLFSVEVEIPSRRITEITSKRIKLVEWDAKTETLEFVSKDDPRAVSGSEERFFFHKTKTQWEEMTHPRPRETKEKAPQIVLEEGMNTPPRIVAISRQTHQRVLLLDLNPQFVRRKFGREEEIHWRGGRGEDFRGGIYYPVDYEAGKQYAVVIQTHGFDPSRFWIDGPWTTAFAAQPLAGHGILVLQLDESFDDHNTPEETEREVERIESGIEALDGRGLIDLNRIGMIGFSRTCIYVKQALIRSRYRFAAASVTDGIDGGYFQYLLKLSQSQYRSIYEGINEGPPWGSNLGSWLVHASGFHVESVGAPLRIMAETPSIALFEWEWYAALARLGKPVEMVVTKDGEHVLQKPWERAISQQGNVDWFVFWLKGEQDRDPAKASQYDRWRHLKERMERRQ
jgi:dipeptidyl aminopeptidase/acylaminoacyl peptidase